VGDNVLDEIEFHRKTISQDANSPLHLIREKEMEISGRVLEAKRMAEEMVADARKKALDRVQAAEEEGNRLAQSHEKDITEKAEAEITALREQTDREVQALSLVIGKRTAQAAEFVARVVKGQ
jgi:vacuolar-type H+-ATPase subunit H